MFSIDTSCFDQPTYVVKEDDGFVSLNLTFSRTLRHDTKVQFRYYDLYAHGKIHIYVAMYHYNMLGICAVVVYRNKLKIHLVIDY